MNAFDVLMNHTLPTLLPSIKDLKKFFTNSPEFACLATLAGLATGAGLTAKYIPTIIQGISNGIKVLDMTTTANKRKRNVEKQKKSMKPRKSVPVTKKRAKK